MEESRFWEGVIGNKTLNWTQISETRSKEEVYLIQKETHSEWFTCFICTWYEFLPQSLIREQSLPLHSSHPFSSLPKCMVLSYNLLTRFYLLFVWLVMSFPLEEHSHFHASHSTYHPVFLVSSKLIALVLMAMLFILQGRSHRKSLQIYTEIKCVNSFPHPFFPHLIFSPESVCLLWMYQFNPSFSFIRLFISTLPFFMLWIPHLFLFTTSSSYFVLQISLLPFFFKMIFVRLI